MVACRSSCWGMTVPNAPHSHWLFGMSHCLICKHACKYDLCAFATRLMVLWYVHWSTFPSLLNVCSALFIVFFPIYIDAVLCWLYVLQTSSLHLWLPLYSLDGVFWSIEVLKFNAIKYINILHCKLALFPSYLRNPFYPIHKDIFQCFY